MSSTTLNRLVRDQILAEGPDIASERDRWPSQDAYEHRCQNYVNEQLNDMTNVELLERISDALDRIMRELPTRLGI
jgi:hypothetical protein